MATQNSKSCTRCGQVKPLSEFYKRKNRPIGYASACRDCSCKKARRYRKENREDISKRRRKHYKENATEIYRRVRQYKLKNKEKWAAHWTISNDVMRGIIPSARELDCKQCGNQADDYHHHRGYAKKHRRDVIPLCRYCHQREHAKATSG